ncbi:MAG: hypothetical protein HDR23_01405 [Lachnospiraceae bacterium]|nr:hypothetical protein [Lachnospiraceae bacterium]MBD5455131.1 hypothetical protein [Lachnospiraceae bacterium]
MGTFGGYTGSMNIPEEKRDEFARQVIRILNYGGMMQFERISMYGHDMALLKPVELYPRGKVDFHFNYFEDDSWETAGFDADRGYFYSGKIGEREFCDVVTAVHFLYEAWDEELGFTEINGDIIDDCHYTGWINHLLGTKFSMKKRFRIWDNVEKYALERVGEYEDPTVGEVMQFIPIGMRYGAGGVEFSDLMYIMHGTESLTEGEIEPDTYPADVYGCKKALEVFLRKNQEKDAVSQIWELIKKTRCEREKIKDIELLDIGRFSLILPAKVIVYLTAEIKEESFWERWKEMHETVYHDEIMKEYTSQKLKAKRKKFIEKPILPVRTSEFLHQDGYFIFYDTPEELKGKPNYYISDDDRLYWWDGTDEVILSEKMDNWLRNLAHSHKEISQNMVGEPENANDFLKNFLMLLVEIDQYYKRILPFQNMFYEFLQNGSKTEYRAAVKLLKKISDENKEEGKIIEKVKYSWDLTSRNVTHNAGRLKLKRYLSVMANRRLREKYFGF